MGNHLGRFARASLFLALAIVGLVPAPARAQTAVPNPTTLVFTASTDHDVVLPGGLAAVDHYSFDVYLVGAAQPFQQTDIGKPTAAADGTISYDFRDRVASWPLPGGTYEARVAAVGPDGTGTSEPSNPFTFSSCTYALSGTSASLPAAGGGTQVGVTTGTGCTWTATSNVGWIALSTGGGTGSGTVVATVAANGSTSSRSGALTVANGSFAITQAGAVVSVPAPPGVPTSPSPANGASGVGTSPTLAWTSSGAVTYALRAGTTTPPSQQVVSGTTVASYAPGVLSAGTTYYWQIVATNAGGSTTGPVWSFTTAAPTVPPPPTSLPSPWTSRDVGAVTLSGSASYSSGTFSVAASGADIWGTADAFRYVYQPLSGNGEIVARVTGLLNTNTYAKAGVMIRESLTAGSRHVMLDLRPGGQIEFMDRPATGASTTYLGGATQVAPAWLKLARARTTVTASVSADGKTWRTVGSVNLRMATSVYVGLCVASHNSAARTTATFDHVTMTKR